MASLQKPSRALARTARQAVLQSRRHVPSSTKTIALAGRQTPSIATRPFSITSVTRMPGLMPDAEHPQPPPEDTHPSTRTATALSDEHYHQQADEFLEKINERLEELVEQRDDVDVEYSSGTINLTVPPNGSYVINKQSPNHQIWLSSPISGPFRYDWVVEGESMDQKEGSGEGDWVYLRDGTSLADLLRKEIGVDVSVGDLEEQLNLKSTDPTE